MKHLKSYKIFESKTNEEDSLELSKILQSEIFDDMDIYFYDTEENGDWDDDKEFDFWEWNYGFDGEKRGINVRVKYKENQTKLFESLEKYREFIESQLDIKISFYFSGNRKYILINII